MGHSQWVVPVVLIALGGLLGCAFTDRHVNLTPPISASFATAASPASAAQPRVLSVARPQDLRPDPTTVGNVRNGYGMVTAQVRSNNDVPMWVANFLISGLERAGYRVERTETIDAAQAPVVLDIAVSRVFADYTQGFLTTKGSGDVAAQIEVYKAGRRLFRRVYTGRYETSELFVTTSASEYQTLLDRAMSDFLQKAVLDLDASLSRIFEEEEDE